MSAKVGRCLDEATKEAALDDVESRGIPVRNLDTVQTPRIRELSIMARNYAAAADTYVQASNKCEQNEGLFAELHDLACDADRKRDATIKELRHLQADHDDDELLRRRALLEYCTDIEDLELTEQVLKEVQWCIQCTESNHTPAIERPT